MSLIFFKRFNSLPEAELALGLLQAMKVKCLLQKDGIAGAGGLVQGAELFIEEEQKAEAARILNEA